ncbi:polysaccharide pyruvyl transferase family protein [Ruficoccus amylovorans]|uniref:Polysaccharide pyruvyl transferase family protein n=1 Tax=Ruficoccus amylovorans TaxID=1804625 RepID=A0A842HG67_9BACT|nr:polysaccharide pyruvyl transferase family protein [Ruficoccus amylovorans]MBC2595279.1 polysaccharide pyruvyl transferase family protein [Ruficoccus amylovorans]
MNPSSPHIASPSPAGTRRRTILLTGTASAHNKGDATMQQVVAAEAIKALGSDTTVILASPAAAHDCTRYDGLTVIPSHRRRLSFIPSLALAALWRVLSTLTHRQPDWLLFSRELRQTRRADLVVDLSGDMLTEDYGPLIGFSHFIPLLMARWLRTPYFICAQSIGPFKKLRPLARSVLSHAAAITIREDLTRERVATLNLRMETTADVSFLLEPDHEAAAALLQASAWAGKRLIGVSVSPILKARFEQAHPGESFAQVMAASLNEALADQDIALLFIPHVTGPADYNDDRPVAAEITRHLSLPSLFIEDDLRPAVLKGLIARCEIFVGARMHANMAALSQGVPLIALSYSHKSAGIMAAFGQEGKIIDGKDLARETLVRQIKELLANRECTAAQIRQHHAAVLARSSRNIAILAELVKS